MDPTLAEVPPGALPSEVADNVDIKASEGEYVIPADVVCYLGLDYIEKMVNKAKEGLAEKHAEGRIGGATQAPQEEAPAGTPMMAEGGLVKIHSLGLNSLEVLLATFFMFHFSQERLLQLSQREV